MQLTPENTVAFSIDLQTRLVPAMNNSSRLISKTQLLLSGLAVFSIPIVVTRQYPKGLGDTIEEIKSVLPLSTRFFDKTSFSCLQTKEIREYCISLVQPNILLSGIETHICIMQTALDLINLGKRVFLVADSVSSRYTIDDEIAQKRLYQAGVVPSTTESVLFELTKGASSSYFKAISKLVTGKK